MVHIEHLQGIEKFIGIWTIDLKIVFFGLVLLDYGPNNGGNRQSYQDKDRQFQGTEKIPYSCQYTALFFAQDSSSPSLVRALPPSRQLWLKVMPVRLLLDAVVSFHSFLQLL